MSFQYKECLHRTNIPLPITLTYCLLLSSLFVGSLYLFVPTSVHCLPRDHSLHIQWRTGIIVSVMMVAMGAYPYIFCTSERRKKEDSLQGEEDDDPLLVVWYYYTSYLGLSSWQPIQDLKIACHVLLLYLGSLSCSWLRAYHCMRMLQWEEEDDKTNNNNNNNKSVRRDDESSSVKSTKVTAMSHEEELLLLPTTIPQLKYVLQYFSHHIWEQTIRPSMQLFYYDERYRWIKLRNLVVAPLAEEVVFRAGMLSPLLASSTTTTTTATTSIVRSSHDGKKSRVLLTPTTASWIAPSFFGVAHLHHFYEQYRQIPKRNRSRNTVIQLLLGLLVQWVYTTLFGVYVSHIFIRTASLSGVILAHIICNYMGLPEIDFANPTSSLYSYRYIIWTMYVMGIYLFAVGFDSNLFPNQSRLPALLRSQNNDSISSWLE